jgi:hypothetical protein
MLATGSTESAARVGCVALLAERATHSLINTEFCLGGLLGIGFPNCKLKKQTIFRQLRRQFTQFYPSVSRSIGMTKQTGVEVKNYFVFLDKKGFRYSLKNCLPISSRSSTLCRFSFSISVLILSLSQPIVSSGMRSLREYFFPVSGSKL